MMFANEYVPLLKIHKKWLNIRSANLQAQVWSLWWKGLNDQVYFTMDARLMSAYFVITDVYCISIVTHPSEILFEIFFNKGWIQYRYSHIKYKVSLKPLSRFKTKHSVIWLISMCCQLSVDFCGSRSIGSLCLFLNQVTLMFSTELLVIF